MPAKVKAPDSFFLPYQTAWIKDHSRLKLIEKSRQIGLSWSTAYNLVRRHSLAGHHEDTWVTSRDELQAKLFVDDCTAWANILHTAAKNLGLVVLDEEKRHKAYVVEFGSRTSIYSLSSNPDAQAGKRGSRVLDEFALHPDQRMLWAVAYPGITWGGGLEVISTHRGSGTLFNKLVLDARENGNPMHISLHRVTLQDALEQGFLSKLQAKLPKDDPRQEMDEADYFDYIRSGCIDEESFLQEYMCVPSDDASAFISYELIDRNLYAPGEVWETALDDAASYYMGVDIGRKNDLTVISLFEAGADGLMLMRRKIELKNVPFSEQLDAISELGIRHGVRRICVDATGIGMMPAEELQRRLGGKVEPVLFTAPTKADMAVYLRRAMEDGKLRLPRDRALEADLRQIRKETTSAGNVRYVGERTADGHADRFWSIALALHARGHYAGEPHFGSIGAVPLGGARHHEKPRRAAGVFGFLSRFRIS